MNGCPKCSCPLHSNQTAQATLSNNQVTTTTKKIIKTEFSENEYPQTNMRMVTSNITRNADSSLRNSRITRKTVYGEKYDYGEKIKEKRNYILYASGTVREKKEIEQIEQPQPQPTILEEHEIIDNYKYLESKNIRKQNPNRLSFTIHKRLSGPFEKTTYTQVDENNYPYQSYTTKSQKMRYNSVNNKINYDTYNPNNYKNYRNVSVENYRYQNRIPYNENITKTEIIRNDYRNNKKNLGYYETNFDDKYEYIVPETQNVEIYEQNIRNIPNNNQYNFYNKQILNEGNSYTETKQDGDYMVKITTTKNSLSNDYNNLNNTWNYKNNYRNNNFQNNNFDKNFNYYESKNIRRTEYNKPVSYDFSREQNLRSNSYNCNLRNVGFGNSGEYRRFEKITRSGGYCACGKEHYGDNVCRQKFESEEEVYCPVHGRQTIRREFDY